MAFKFKGGVHPDYRKHPEVPVTVIAPPKQVVIPMAQHIGAPCTPLVKKGDTVKMYQKIGDTQAPVSAPVHASVSGTVVAVEPRPHPLGDMVMSVVIENDGLDTPDLMEPLTEAQLKDPEAILRRIREAGVVGMGGAMFPTAFKIQSGRGKVDTLIINGAECEPYINGDHLTMRQFPKELLKGIELTPVTIPDPPKAAEVSGAEIMEMEVMDLAKNPVKLGSLISGNKVTMLNFWGTFCGPCIGEMPDLGDLERKYKDQGFEILGLTSDIVDYQGNMDEDLIGEAEDIAADTGVTYPILITSMELMEYTQLVAFPTTYFVDAQGNMLRGPVVGSQSQETWEKIITELLEAQK